MAPHPSAIATAACAGPWGTDPLTERLAGLGGWSGPEELAGVVGALVARRRRAPRGSSAGVEAEVAALLAGPRRHRRVEQPDPVWRLPVPRWTDLSALATALHLDVGELVWFADPGGWLRHAPDGPLTHYRRHWTPSRSGTPRLIEAPAPRLAELQRRIARRVLARIPVHPAAHGHVRGRSPHTLAEEHRARPMVLRLDLEGFYSHVTGGRVAGLLRVAGYPPAVADTIAGLLVTATPPGVLRACPHRGDPATRRRMLDRLAAPHLPQGAPSSPTVANLLTYGLDRRLSGLATAVGAAYGRYADDLVFSGDAALPVHGLTQRVAAIAAEEGFRVRPDKTRIMPAHHRQRVVGLVVNSDAPAASRRDHDELRAILHNAARTGPDAQNRAGHPAFREHLLGRIAWVGHGRPARAARLRELFDRISW